MDADIHILFVIYIRNRYILIGTRFIAPALSPW